MPIEVENQGYLFAPICLLDPSASLEDNSMENFSNHWIQNFWCRNDSFTMLPQKRGTIVQKCFPSLWGINTCSICNNSFFVLLVRDEHCIMQSMCEVIKQPMSSGYVNHDCGQTQILTLYHSFSRILLLKLLYNPLNTLYYMCIVVIKIVYVKIPVIEKCRYRTMLQKSSM